MKLSYTFPLVASVSSQDGLTKISMNSGIGVRARDRCPKGRSADAAVIAGAAMSSFWPPWRSMPETAVRVDRVRDDPVAARAEIRDSRRNAVRGPIGRYVARADPVARRVDDLDAVRVAAARRRRVARPVDADEVAGHHRVARAAGVALDLDCVLPEPAIRFPSAGSTSARSLGPRRCRSRSRARRRGRSPERASAGEPPDGSRSGCPGCGSGRPVLDSLDGSTRMPFPPFTSTLASAPAPPWSLLSPVTSISAPDDSSWAESAPTPNQSPAILFLRLDLDALPGEHDENPPNASPRTVEPPEPPARSSARPTAALAERRQRHPGRVRRRSRFSRAVDADRRGDGRQRGEERDGLRPSTRDGELDRGAAPA